MDKLKDYLQRRRDGLDFDTPGEELWSAIRGRIGSEVVGVVALPGASDSPDGLTVSRRRRMVIRIIRYAAAACVLAAIVMGIKGLNKPRVPKVTTENIARVSPAPPVRAVPGPPVKITVMPKITLTPSSAATAQGSPRDAVNANSSSATASAPVHRRVRPPQKTGVLPGNDPGTSPLDILEKDYATQVQQQLSALQRTPLYAETPAYFSGFKNRLSKIDADETRLLKKIRLAGMDETLMDQLIRLYEEKLTVLRRLQMEMNKINRCVRPQAAPSTVPNFPDI
jgi:hypothetical protein